MCAFLLSLSFNHVYHNRTRAKYTMRCRYGRPTDNPKESTINGKNRTVSPAISTLSLYFAIKIETHKGNSLAKARLFCIISVNRSRPSWKCIYWTTTSKCHIHYQLCGSEFCLFSRFLLLLFPSSSFFSLLPSWNSNNHQ